jgi:sarcosine oxidase
MYELNAGFLLPERCIAAHADLAMRHGAEIHGHEPVTAWEADRLSVTVRTAAGAYRAARLVVCGGAWSDKLVRDLGVPLRVTRQVLGWVQPRTPDAFRLGNFPCWMIEHADGTGHYGFPTVSDNPGFKVAHHAPGPRVDPDTLDRNAVPADERDFRDVLRRFIPGADGPLLSLRLCMYTNSLDGHFILDRHPAHENVAVACGFSGHGFKFASVVGEAMADLATAGTTKLPIGFLGLKRFA